MWAAESHKTAVRYSYADDILRVVTEAEDLKLSKDYFDEMKDVADERVLMAGCRLAKILEELNL